MMTQTRARIVATVAAPLFLLHAAPAHCRPLPVTPATAQTRLDHISITVMGKGSPVVLIPGLASPRATWDGIAPTLAGDHTVYLVQVNGFAGDAPGANLRPGVLDGIVADLSRYLADRHVARPAVIGHSMGGLVGLMFAHAHPDQIGRLMVVDSLPFFGRLFGPTATVEMIRPQAAAMRDKAAATFDQPAARTAGADAVAAQMTLTPAARAKVATWAAAADPRVTGEAMYEDLTTDLSGDLATIATPITLLYPYGGALPQATADALYRDAYKTAPHVTFVPVADSAHFVMLDQPAAFGAAVAAFLR